MYVLIAIRKGLWAVKLRSIKILQFPGHKTVVVCCCLKTCVTVYVLLLASSLVIVFFGSYIYTHTTV